MTLFDVRPSLGNATRGGTFKKALRFLVGIILDNIILHLLFCIQHLLLYRRKVLFCPVKHGIKSPILSFSC